VSQVHVERVFEGIRSIGSPIELSDLELVRCRIRRCVLDTTQSPTRRAVLRSILVKDAQVNGCALRGVVIQDCTIDNVTLNDLFIPQACAFAHVTLRRNVGRLLLGSSLSSVPESVAQQFDAANAMFYKNLDWALDITEAVADELEIRNIPAHLIRRDPDRHFVFRQRTAVQGAKRAQEMGAGVLRVWLEDLATYGPEAAVFAVPDRHPKRGVIEAAIKDLRAQGIAE
jgi:hypothetical protein